MPRAYFAIVTLPAYPYTSPTTLPLYSSSYYTFALRCFWTHTPDLSLQPRACHSVLRATPSDLAVLVSTPLRRVALPLPCRHRTFSSLLPPKPATPPATRPAVCGRLPTYLCPARNTPGFAATRTPPPLHAFRHAAIARRTFCHNSRRSCCGCCRATLCITYPTLRRYA